ncbi:MAG: nitroreductase family protein [Ruminococcus sp.]|nr:nitroreductase family protein [Ruminococcus sp.]
MDLLQAIYERHSVRVFNDKPLDDVLASALVRLITTYNAESGLHMQLIQNERKAFSGLKARYGKFKGVKNYIALIGRKGADLEEMCGYFGEMLVLEAQALGLKTCWVGGTYRKVPKSMMIEKGEKLVAVIAVGYSDEDGVQHKSKEFNEVSKTIGAMPEWYTKGVEAALLAPTAINQQKFVFELISDEKVRVTAGFGPFSKVDLGIVKCHFEIASGKDETIWTV